MLFHFTRSEDYPPVLSFSGKDVTANFRSCYSEVIAAFPMCDPVVGGSVIGGLLETSRKVPRRFPVGANHDQLTLSAVLLCSAHDVDTPGAYSSSRE
jgi:hypothetical protein